MSTTFSGLRSRFINHFAGCYLPVICQWLCKTSFTHFQFHYLHHVPFILRQSKETDLFYLWSKSSRIFSCNSVGQWNPAPKNDEIAVFLLPMLSAMLSAIGAMLLYLPYPQPLGMAFTSCFPAPKDIAGPCLTVNSLTDHHTLVDLQVLIFFIDCINYQIYLYRQKNTHIQLV